MNNDQKLSKIKANIADSLLPNEEVTYDQMKNAIIHGQSFASLETDLANSAALSPFAETELIFHTKRIDMALEWTWDVECDVCAICRNDVVDACMRCQSENTAKVCAIVWGVCGHSFHHHCMQMWHQHALHGVQLCPLFQREWSTARISS